MDELDLSLSYLDKSLLLTCVNAYKEKIEFILKNSKFYLIDSIIIDDFKRDLRRLEILQNQLLSIEVTRD